MRQVVTQSQNALVAVAADTGALLWKLPLKTPYEQNAVTPIVSGRLVVYSGLDVPLTAARPVKKGASFVLETAWTNPDVASYLSTPVLEGGRIYGLSHKKKGQWFCVDAASGRTLWLSDGRQAESAALLAGAGTLFLLDTDGSLTVAAADATGFRAAAQVERRRVGDLGAPRRARCGNPGEGRGHAGLRPNPIDIDQGANANELAALRPRRRAVVGHVRAHAPQGSGRARQPAARAACAWASPTS